MTRKPAVAGSFYPGTKKAIESALAGFDKKLGGWEPEFKKLFGVVVPHAGWEYSGFTAAHSYAALKKCVREESPRFVILHPNHTGAGLPLAMSLEDWETPLGTAKCDAKLAETIAANSDFLAPDEEAHAFEHSAEVQIPFLQHNFKKFSFVAICFGDQGLPASRDIANTLWKASEKNNFHVIASSDFTHYEPADQAKEKDTAAIGLLKKLDAAGFAGEVERRRLSICGHGAIAAACMYAKMAGAKKGDLLDFSNSGKATGEDSVVDYASLAFV